MTYVRWVLLAVLVLGGCGGDDDDGGSTPDAGTSADANGSAADSGADGGLFDERPYGLVVPDSYDEATPTPLIVLLHGYTASGAVQLGYFGLEEIAQEQNLLVAYPDGTIDSFGNRFWNATDACCDLGATGVDDVAYLTAVMDDVAARYNVDPARVFAIGHSNGGFMSHRMACDRADRIAAIASLAGAVWADPEQCQPSEPVAVLEVHGDADQTIIYEGGDIAGNAYPSAPVTVGTWAAKNGCTGDLAAADTHLDLDSGLAGEETRVDQFAGCPGATAEVELWTIEGGGHVPGLVQPNWPESIVGFLLAHPKK